MMTVREHLKAAGYDPEAAWNADWLQHGRAGIMECNSVEIQTFTCRPSQHEGEMLGVRATAIVPFSDGYEHPYPDGWPNSLEAKVVAYFRIKEDE